MSRKMIVHPSADGGHKAVGVHRRRMSRKMIVHPSPLPDVALSSQPITGSGAGLMFTGAALAARAVEAMDRAGVTGKVVIIDEENPVEGVALNNPEAIPKSASGKILRRELRTSLGVGDG